MAAERGRRYLRLLGPWWMRSNRKQTSIYVRVDSYDLSGPMVELGRKLWLELKSSLKKESSLDVLDHVCGKVIHAYYYKVEPTCSEEYFVRERWLTALHTVYKDPSGDGRELLSENKNSLGRLATAFKPDAALLSCHRDHDSDQRLRETSPLDSTLFPVEKLTPFPMPKLTEWRRTIKSDLGITRELCEKHWYLDNPVLSTWERATAQIYVKPKAGMGVPCSPRCRFQDSGQRSRLRVMVVRFVRIMSAKPKSTTPKPERS